MFGCAIARQIFVDQSTFVRLSTLVARNISVINTRQVWLSNRTTSLKCCRGYGTLMQSERSWPCVSLLSKRSGNFKTSEIQKRYIDVNTNVSKDVLLYKYENPRYFKVLNIFAIVQIFFWTFLAQTALTLPAGEPNPESPEADLPWWKRLNFADDKSRYTVTCITAGFGYILFCSCWLFILKSVRYLVLRKGGKDVTFVTYTPYGENRHRTVPLNMITSKQGRGITNGLIPIKVKGDLLHYLLDARGEFKQPKLFDFTAGLKRSI